MKKYLYSICQRLIVSFALLAFLVTIIAPVAQSFAMSAAQKKIFSYGIPYFDLANCGTVSSSSGTTVDTTGSSDNAEIIFKFLISNNFKYLDNKPMNAVQAAATLGNLWWESGDLDPGAIEGGTGVGLGLAQWSYGRRTNLENFAAEKGKPASDLRLQLEFLKSEFDGADAHGPAALKDTTFQTTTDVNVATERFMTLFEAPGIPHLEERQKQAVIYYDQFKSLAPGSTLANGECPNGGGINIGSYNVLGYYHKEYDGDTDNGFGSSHLNAIASNIRSMGVDVIGLQEYRDGNGNKKQIQDTLGGGWKAAYGPNASDQLPIFYNTDTVTLVSNKYAQNVTSRNSSCTGDPSGTVDANFAKFTAIANGQTFVVINVHPTANEGSSCDSERVDTIKGALANDFAKDFSGPIFLVGDMNSAMVDRDGSSNGIYTYLTGADFAASIETAANSVHVKASIGDSDDWKRSIDFVYYKGISAPTYYETLDCEPKASCGSDHKPVYAIFGAVQSNGSIADTAKLLSWPTKRNHGPDDPKPEYTTALAQVGLNKYGESCVNVGKSCDAFVATVMRYSGLDPDYQCCGAGNQKDYLESHPEKYESLGVVTDTSQLQPGDILNSSSHTRIYIGDGNEASASHCDRTAGQGIVWFGDSPTAFRFKGGGS